MYSIILFVLKKKNTERQGHLAGSAGRACDSWLWGREFKPQDGCRHYLNKTIFKKTQEVIAYIIYGHIHLYGKYKVV